MEERGSAGVRMRGGGGTRRVGSFDNGLGGGGGA